MAVFEIELASNKDARVTHMSWSVNRSTIGLVVLSSSCLYLLGNVFYIYLIYSLIYTETDSYIGVSHSREKMLVNIFYIFLLDIASHLSQTN